MRITTRQGAELDSGPIRFAQGHARHPLDRTALRAKFLDCLVEGGWQSRAEVLYVQLDQLAQVANVRTLSAVLAP